MIDEAINQLSDVVSTSEAIAALGESRATWYRRHRKSPAPEKPERVAAPQPRALSEVERKQIRATLESEEFIDEAPAAAYAKLLDQGVYLGSVSTMYRVLHEHDEVRERRRQATYPAHKKPELIATKPNEIWSWDITKLHGPEKWTYYYLYVILDIWSRYVTGCMLARRERATLDATDERNRRQTGNREGSTHHPRRSRLTHDRQTGDAHVGGPRSHQSAQSTPRE